MCQGRCVGERYVEESMTSRRPYRTKDFFLVQRGQRTGAEGIKKERMRRSRICIASGEVQHRRSAKRMYKGERNNLRANGVS